MISTSLHFIMYFIIVIRECAEILLTPDDSENVKGSLDHCSHQLLRNLLPLPPFSTALLKLNWFLIGYKWVFQTQNLLNSSFCFTTVSIFNRWLLNKIQHSFLDFIKVHFWPFHKPKQHFRHKSKIWCAEVFHRDVARVSQGSHHLCKICPKVKYSSVSSPIKEQLLTYFPCFPSLFPTYWQLQDYLSSL